MRHVALSTVCLLVGFLFLALISPLSAPVITAAAERVQTSRTIAVTFDDLPGTPVDRNCNPAAIVEMNRRLITAAQRAQVPAFGFAPRRGSVDPDDCRGMSRYGNAKAINSPGIPFHPTATTMYCLPFSM